jgi:hypothetical protein
MTEAAELITNASLWRPSAGPEPLDLADSPIDGIRWIEFACTAEHAGRCLDFLAPHCPGLDQKMLEDLLTPDEQPEGLSYCSGEIRLASTFRVGAERPRIAHKRGTAQGLGVLVFEPIELLAGDGWLLSCAHPARTFRGAESSGGGPSLNVDAMRSALVKSWKASANPNAGDLGVALMYELALSYRGAARELRVWLEDWELSLYVDDDLDNADGLPELWSLMAVLRDWLNPLNPPGVRKDIDRAWLPASDHKAVIALDERIDKTLSDIAGLAETLRQSFGLLHLEQAEVQRQRGERVQHRIEIAAAIFLVPTLIVGFYGANTWVPGQGRHWGFWVMVVVLVVLSGAALLAVLRTQRASSAAADRELGVRRRLHAKAVGVRSEGGAS